MTILLDDVRCPMCNECRSIYAPSGPYTYECLDCYHQFDEPARSARDDGDLNNER